jgi:hypothetical protein
MQEQLQAIVTVLSFVNPVVCGAMFARIEGERSGVERRAGCHEGGAGRSDNSHGRRAHWDAIVITLITVATGGEP